MLTFLFAFVDFFLLGALNVKAIESVPWLELLLDCGLGTFDVANAHAVADELRRVRRHIAVASQFVHWVQGVRGLSLCDELFYLGFRAIDVIVSKIELWLV